MSSIQYHQKLHQITKKVNLTNMNKNLRLCPSFFVAKINIIKQILIRIESSETSEYGV